MVLHLDFAIGCLATDLRLVRILDYTFRLFLVLERALVPIAMAFGSMDASAHYRTGSCRCDWVLAQGTLEKWKRITRIGFF